MSEFTFKLGDHSVRGVGAEVVSVLLSDDSLRDRVLQGEEPERLIAALDTTVQAEERVPLALAILDGVRSRLAIGRWLPFHSELAKLEYQNFFATEHYSGYRDHTIHSLQVYLLGWYLYHKCAMVRVPLLSYLATRSVDAGVLDDNELFAEWWGVTSIWHDWG